MLHAIAAGSLLLLATAHAMPAAAATTPLTPPWNVSTNFLQGAPPVYDAATSTLTLSPKFANLTPAYYSFFETEFFAPDNFIIFRLNLNISSDNNMPRFEHFLVDLVTTSVNSSSPPPPGAFHPLESHFHQRTPPEPDTEPYQGYHVGVIGCPSDCRHSTFATFKPARETWNRTHLPVALRPGQSFSWTEPRVHHLDGSFVLMITPILSVDVGNRLRGLLPGGADSTQFTYQDVTFFHFNPVINGSSVNDLLFGGVTSADTISGNFGQDTIYGDGGNDTVDGGEDGDFLFAHSGDDTMNGGNGDDILDGGFGKDSLDGGDGNDLLKGGPARDTMRGGPGADRFMIANAETGVGATARDRITDFNRFQLDKIDLSVIDAKLGAPGNQTFTWIGWNRQFTAAGQLTASQSGANVIVKGNLDTDRTPEIEIQLDNVLGPLQASDFIR